MMHRANILNRAGEQKHNMGVSFPSSVGHQELLTVVLRCVTSYFPASTKRSRAMSLSRHASAVYKYLSRARRASYDASLILMVRAWDEALENDLSA